MSLTAKKLLLNNNFNSKNIIKKNVALSHILFLLYSLSKINL